VVNESVTNGWQMLLVLAPQVFTFLTAALATILSYLSHRQVIESASADRQSAHAAGFIAGTAARLELPVRATTTLPARPDPPGPVAEVVPEKKGQALLDLLFPDRRRKDRHCYVRFSRAKTISAGLGRDY